MKLLQDERDTKNFKAAIKACKKDVYVRHNTKKEDYNVKSFFGYHFAIAKLMSRHGDEYEIFCNDANDEGIMMEFFRQLRENHN